jgi:hypothetical protein
LALSVFDSDGRKPRRSSTWARSERRISSEKLGLPQISKRNADGSIIQAGRQAKEPSGWCTTKYAMPPRSRHLLMYTVSPKHGWNR